MTHHSADRSPNRTRRSALLSLGAGVAAGCAVCSSTIRAMAAAAGDGHAAASARPPHWSYEGEAGPGRWGELSPDFKACQLGVEQTPIDLKNPITAELGKAVDVAYQSRRFRILNNGHTIQVNVEPGSHCVIGGEQYELLQYHFHHPSEHLLAGKGFDLECHFVHRAASGKLAVLGVFVTPGADNATLKPIFDAMPTEESREPSAARQRFLPLYGVADHAALLGRADLDGVQERDRGVAGANPPIRRALPEQCASGPGVAPPLPAAVELTQTR